MIAVIIDDERKARSVLKILIKENCKSITQIFEAEDLLQGVALIKEKQPRIVFLDIEMPIHSGLEILDFIDNKDFNFEIIFTTAYSEYAVKAFQLSAIDYLLKPIRTEQLKASVAKVSRFLENSQIVTKLKELKQSLTASNFNKIGLPVADGITFVNFNEIVLLEADGMYTNVFLSNSEKILISKPLKHFVALLETIPLFFRPHRSYLINIKFIKEYIKKDGGYVVMDNNVSVSISKDNKAEFLNIIQNIG